MNRKEVLQKADACVNGSRQQDYGTPENNFKTIAELWNAYVNSAYPPKNGESGLCLKAKDVPAMMVLLKTARVASGHGKADNWIDIAGYAACGCEIESESGTISREEPDPAASSVSMFDGVQVNPNEKRRCRAYQLKEEGGCS